MHALGDRDDYVDLQISGALMPDLYAVLAKPSVHYRSGFFGPAERFLRDSGASIDFVPADFRRFEPILEKMRPRIMATAGSLPVDGWVSLSVHAGATVDEIHRASADPERILLVEVSEHFPRTFGLAPHEHRIHVDVIDCLIESDRTPLNLADTEPSDAERTIADIALSFIHSGAHYKQVSVAFRIRLHFHLPPATWEISVCIQKCLPPASCVYIRQEK